MVSKCWKIIGDFIRYTGDYDLGTWQYRYAVESIKKGAYDFLEKPLDLNRLLITIRNAMDKSTLITQTQVLKNKVSRMYENCWRV